MEYIKTKCQGRLQLENHFAATLFIKETGNYLKLSEVTIASACVLYHRFMAAIDDLNNFDANVVGCTALYLAGKVEENPCKLRDLINMAYSILNKNKPPIDIADKYWRLRDSIVKCELLFLRLLSFKVAVDNPHKYMLHYLKSLEDWCEEESWELSQLPQMCWCVLSDFFHTTLCLEESAACVAVAVIYLCVMCTGLKIPMETADKKWWQVFCDDKTEEDIQDIVGRIIKVYEFETKQTVK